MKCFLFPSGMIFMKKSVLCYKIHETQLKEHLWQPRCQYKFEYEPRVSFPFRFRYKSPQVFIGLFQRATSFAARLQFQLRHSLLIVVNIYTNIFNMKFDRRFQVVVKNVKANYFVIDPLVYLYTLCLITFMILLIFLFTWEYTSKIVLFPVSSLFKA